MMACCLWGCMAAQAGTPWFNVMGDAAQESVNTIEVDPTPIAIAGQTRTLRVRVSRSKERISWDGVAYRSYVSDVLFDCASSTARYLSIDYYHLPAWKGEVYARRVYPESEPRLMEFRDVEPNPNRRIIRAACQTYRITSN